MTRERAQVRPYWHVDAKWVTGLLLIFVLSVTLIVQSLVQVTDEKTAVDALTLTLAISLSPGGLDDPTGPAIMRDKLQASPDKTIQIVPGLRWTVSEQEIAGLEPRQARLYMFRKLAVPIYQEGIQGFAKLADDPEMKASMLSGGAMFDVLTLKTHQTLQQILAILVIVCLALLVPLIFFSARFGRIGSPGCVLCVASFPGALILGILSTVNQSGASPANPATGSGETFNYIVGLVVLPMVRGIVVGFWIALAIGVGLVLVAVFGNLIWAIFRKKKTIQDST